ncbi:MAG: ComEC/Rec2 family competence protein, partial [Steroidobacter sp.]
MLIIALAFFLGDTWVQCVPALDVTWLLSPIVGVCILAAFIRRRTAIHACIAFVLGIAWAGGHAWWQLQDDLQPQLEGRDVAVTGVIASIPQHESYGLRFVFATESNGELRVPSQLQISWYSNNVQVHAGERWHLILKLKRRHGFANPGSFDYEGQLFREGIGATGYVRDSNDHSNENRLLGVASGNVILRMRAALAESISAAIPDSPMQGVIR